LTFFRTKNLSIPDFLKLSSFFEAALLRNFVLTKTKKMDRIRINQTDPAAYRAMFALDKYIENSSLSKTHWELIKIRASQLNGCSFCVDKHSKDARANGETERRIFALSCWKETPFFDEQERAILQLTEEVTLIAGRVSDETYNQAVSLLGDTYLTQVIMGIITINAWNRIGISTKMEPEL
jgi:AhpD family alkylhydroperoxidase